MCDCHQYTSTEQHKSLCAVVCWAHTIYTVPEDGPSGTDHPQGSNYTVQMPLLACLERVHHELVGEPLPF